MKLLKEEEAEEAAMKQAKIDEEAEAAKQMTGAVTAVPPADEKTKKRIRVRMDDGEKNPDGQHKDEEFYS
jgi:hypothetical protein